MLLDLKEMGPSAKVNTASGESPWFIGLMMMMVIMVMFAAVDPCLVNNGGCSLDAVCKRTRPGLRDCVCNNGFAGDGLVCIGMF